MIMSSRLLSVVQLENREREREREKEFRTRVCSKLNLCQKINLKEHKTAQHTGREGGML